MTAAPFADLLNLAATLPVREPECFTVDAGSPLHTSLLRTTAAKRAADALWQRLGAIAEPDLPTLAVDLDGACYEVEFDGSSDDDIDLVSVVVGGIDILPVMSSWAISALTNATRGELQRQNERAREDMLAMQEGTR